MTRVAVPLPYKDRIDAYGGLTYAQVHEAVTGSRVCDVPISVLTSTQKTVGGPRLEMYESGKVHKRPGDEPIVIAHGGELYIHNGHHRTTLASKLGQRSIRARVASTGPRPPIRFRERGAAGEFLLMDPKATAVKYREHDVQDVAEMVGDIAVIEIDTPLESKPGAAYWGYFDDYESIFCRFKSAIEDDDVRAVLLKIDSPGGAAQGLNECCDAMIRLKKKTGKRVVAYADEGAYSAAYAIACTADEIYLPKAGGLGSIGAVSMLVDWTKANKREGIRVEVITSGARKADGNPNVKMTDAAIRHVHRRVDGLAKLYFKLVKSSRGIDARPLEADTFYGKRAVRKGLADDVLTLEETLQRMQDPLDRKGSSGSPSKSKRNSGQSDGDNMNEKKARAALDAAIAKGDAKAIERAAKSLADVQAGRKIVTTETKSTESSKSESSKSSDSSGSSESSKSSEEEEEEESEKMPSNEESKHVDTSDIESSSSSSSSSKSSEEDEEEEEEEEEEKYEKKDEEESRRVSREVASALKAPGADPRAIVRAAVRATLAKQAPLRAVAKAAAKVTGRKSLSSIAGALDAMPPVKKLAKEVESLKRDKIAAKVDSYLSKAKRAGKIGRAQVESLRAQGMRDPKWLKGHLATLPALVKTKAGAFVPRDDAGGAPENEEQKAMMSAAMVGMTDDERKKFEEGMNGKSKRQAPRF